MREMPKCPICNERIISSFYCAGGYGGSKCPNKHYRVEGSIYSIDYWFYDENVSIMFWPMCEEDYGKIHNEKAKILKEELVEKSKLRYFLETD